MLDRGGVRRAIEILGVLASLYLGGMIFYAGGLKAADPALFVEQIRGYGILPALAGVAAIVLLWAEFLLGFALIVRVAPRWALLGFAALMVMFIGVTAYAWSQGRTEDCGCFGRLGGRTPGLVILEDSIFLLIAAFSYWAAGFGHTPWLARERWRWIATAALAPLALALPWIAPKLPVDSLVTGIGPGYNIARLAADDLKVDLSEGPVFVALLGEDCAPCVAALPMMGELAQREDAPKVIGVFSGDRAKKQAWRMQHTPAFPLAHATEKSLRQYYRTLPVFFLAHDGTVKRIWWGRAPAADEVIAGMAR